jgi:hypothetical protein
MATASEMTAAPRANRNTETASATAASATIASYGDHRLGLNHVSAKARARARLPRDGQLVNRHLARSRLLGPVRQTVNHGTPPILPPQV